jgi:putative ABC transport system permease protein
MLVKVLHGGFDPASSNLSVPWTYLLALAGISVTFTVIAAVAAPSSARRPHGELLRAI